MKYLPYSAFVFAVAIYPQLDTLGAKLSLAWFAYCAFVGLHMVCWETEPTPAKRPR